MNSCLTEDYRSETKFQETFKNILSKEAGKCPVFSSRNGVHLLTTHTKTQRTQRVHIFFLISLCENGVHPLISHTKTQRTQRVHIFLCDLCGRNISFRPDHFSLENVALCENGVHLLTTHTKAQRTQRVHIFLCDLCGFV